MERPLPLRTAGTLTGKGESVGGTGVAPAVYDPEDRIIYAARQAGNCIGFQGPFRGQESVGRDEARLPWTRPSVPQDSVPSNKQVQTEDMSCAP